MINEAARMAKDSKPMEDILKRLEDMRTGTQVYTALDTLDYLAKSGRIGRAARLMGTVLDIKPILTLKNGAIDAFDRQRSRPRALATLRELAVKASKGRKGTQIGIMHAASQDDARKMADELRAELNPEVLIISDIGPSVGVYVGPGAIGVAWYAPPQ
jgi:DegV family protein with EDD domain